MVSNEVDVGYKVTVSKMFEASGVADESGEFVVHPEPDSYVDANTQYLVTLDVNGVNKLYRELWTSGDLDDNTNVALSDYTYITDEEKIAGLTEDDAVVVRFEEVEVYTTDSFRAAVNKVAPAAAASEGGSGTGGVLVVHETVSGDTHTLDKTYQEIADAEFAVLIFEGTGRDVGFYFPYALESYGSGGNAYFVQFNAVIYMASNTSDYPYYVDEQSMQ